MQLIHLLLNKTHLSNKQVLFRHENIVSYELKEHIQNDNLLAH
jgi:hypothetical protein